MKHKFYPQYLNQVANNEFSSLGGACNLAEIIAETYLQMGHIAEAETLLLKTYQNAVEYYFAQVKHFRFLYVPYLFCILRKFILTVDRIQKGRLWLVFNYDQKLSMMSALLLRYRFPFPRKGTFSLAFEFGDTLLRAPDIPPCIRLLAHAQCWSAKMSIGDPEVVRQKIINEVCSFINKKNIDWETVGKIASLLKDKPLLSMAHREMR